MNNEEKLTQSINGTQSYSSVKEWELLKESFEKSFLDESVRFEYFMMNYAEQKLIKGIEDKLSLEEYTELLYTFSEYSRRIYEGLFAGELQQMEIEDLPACYQAAMWIKIYFEELEEDLKTGISCLGKVAVVYPALEEPIKYYLSIMKEKILSQSLQAQEKKIKVAFLVQMLEVWDKQAPVYEAMRKRNDFEVFILLVPAFDFAGWKLMPYEDEEEFFRKRYPNANIIKVIENGKVLDISGFAFDYVFYQRPYDHYLPRALHSEIIAQFTKTCYIPYGYQGANVFTDGNTNVPFFKNIHMSFLDSTEIKDILVDTFKDTVQNNSQKFYDIGYPVFDTYLNLENKREDGSILWTPRWVFDPVFGGSHFLEYKDTFIALREKYPEKEMVIRPHPLMWENIVREGLMSQDEVNLYKDQLQKANIDLDANKMMEDTIENSKVLITDYSSTTITYFMTGKPIIYCPFETQLNEMYQKLLPGLYIANSWEEVEKYLEMIENGEDVLYQTRQDIIEKELKCLGGGTNNIVETIVADYNENQ